MRAHNRIIPRSLVGTVLVLGPKYLSAEMSWR